MRHALQRNFGAIALACIAIVLTLAAPAVADTEPNDVISQAEGPVGGGAPISGTLSTIDDADYYVFYVEGQHRLHVTFTNLSLDGDWCMNARVKDSNGEDMAQDETTGAGVNRYFVAVWATPLLCSSAAHAYSVQLDPAAALVSGPAMDTTLVSTAEPNDRPDQAQGPLAGGVNYVGAAATSDDVDWFSFYVGTGTHRLDVSVTKPLPDCDGDVEASLYGGDLSTSLRSAKGGAGSFGHLIELAGPARYYLKLTSAYGSCVNASWQFRIDPAGALSSTPPPPPSLTAPPTPLRTTPKTMSPWRSAECVSARISRTRWTGKVAATKRRLRRSHRMRTKRALRKKLAAEQRTLRRVRNRVVIFC